MSRRSEFDATAGFRAPFKGNPQQGTLFHAPIDDLDPTGQRYANIRGYTPDRFREVREAVGEVKFASGPPGFATPRGGGPPDATLPPHRDPVTNDQKRDLGEGGARIVETLARSTAPIEDIASVKQFSVNPTLGANGMWMPREGELTFGRSSFEVDDHRAGFGTGHPTPELQRLEGQTVVHELGHAADPTLTPERGVRNELSGHNMGRLEQNADDYALEHYQHDPRAGRRETFEKETGTYPGAAPDSVAPRRLRGYEKWAERSAAAVDDLAPRWTEVAKRGETYPATPAQRNYAVELASERAAQKKENPGPEQLKIQGLPLKF